MPEGRDWAAVKAAYVEGFEEDGVRVANPTLEQLEARFDIPLSTLRKRSGLEHWGDERNLFGTRLERAKQEKTTQVLASKGAEFDALALRVAEKILKKIEAKADGEVSPAQLAALAAGVKGAQYVGRLVMGDSTDNARLYAELLQKPDLSMLSPAELEQLEAIMNKARPAA